MTAFWVKRVFIIMGVEYIQSETTKRIQLTELEIFKAFKEVCQKNNLIYFAEGGTLLGAARHNGFIPWDDDLDICMLWNDYKKFMNIAPNAFNYPFMFQDYRSDEFGEVTVSRVRDSETTGVTKWEYDNIMSEKYNRGVFIDIFPLFSVPNDEEKRRDQKSHVMKAWRAIRGWNALQNLKKGFRSEYEIYIDDYKKMESKYSIQQIKQIYIDACAMFDNSEEADYIGPTAFRTHDDRSLWKREWFQERVELSFEDTTITCPKYYDEVLTKSFGDWRVPQLSGAYHEIFLLDLNTPYYLNTVLRNRLQLT